MWTGLYFSVRKNTRELSSFKCTLMGHPGQGGGISNGEMRTTKLYCKGSVNWAQCVLRRITRKFFKHSEGVFI